MNKAFLISLLNAFAVTQLSGAGPDDVAGVRWASSPAQVQEILSARPGVSLEAETPDTLTFTGGTFASFEAKRWHFTFTDAKVSSVTIAIRSKPGQDSKGWFADHDFWSLLKLLEGKYGKARAVHDQNHHLRSWQFRDALAPTALKTIELYRGWRGKREPLELVYAYTRPTAPKGIRVFPATPCPKEDI